MASEAVLKYLVDTNRPYSCADVTVNLRGVYTKTVVQKTLDALSESGKIKCKLYGKQKVYAAIQQDTTEVDTGIEDCDSKFKCLTQSLADKSNTLKGNEATLKCLTSTPTNETAQLLINETKGRINCLETKLATLRNSTEVVSADEKKTIMDDHTKVYKEYRKRKRMATDMIEAILEGYPKSKKDLIQELCIETDEMVDFKIASNNS